MCRIAQIKLDSQIDEGTKKNDEDGYMCCHGLVEVDWDPQGGPGVQCASESWVTEAAKSDLSAASGGREG